MKPEQPVLLFSGSCSHAIHVSQVTSNRKG
jgi:hypothetical protein